METLTDEDVVFFGKLTAGLTHEIKNILAIIKEASGLMEDLAALSPLPDARHQAKFKTALETIKTQLVRGIELSTVFNRFAHSPDKPVSEINLHEIAGQVVVLAQRFARLKHISLAPPGDDGDRRLCVQGNSVWVQLALFTGIECCLEVLPGGSTLSLRPETLDARPGVVLRCAGELPDLEAFHAAFLEASRWPVLLDIMTRLKGEVRKEAAFHGFRLLFE